jgi:hypothetical protein
VSLVGSQAIPPCGSLERGTNDAWDLCGRHSLWMNHKIQYQIMVVGAKSNALDAQR